jgi:hypothetical protein
LPLIPTFSPFLEIGLNYAFFNKFRLIFLTFLFWIPTLTLPFSKGGNSVELGATVFPPFEKGRVRVGIHNETSEKSKRQNEFGKIPHQKFIDLTRNL